MKTMKFPETPTGNPVRGRDTAQEALNGDLLTVD